MAICILLSLQVLVPRQFARVCRIVNMDECVKENCVAVIALHNCRKSHSHIFELLKPLKSLQKFIYWANKHYNERCRVEDRARPGGPRCVRTEATIKTVWEQIHQNPLPKQKIMSQELNI